MVRGPPRRKLYWFFLLTFISRTGGAEALLLLECNKNSLEPIFKDGIKQGISMQMPIPGFGEWGSPSSETVAILRPDILLSSYGLKVCRRSTTCGFIILMKQNSELWDIPELFISIQKLHGCSSVCAGESLSLSFWCFIPTDDWERMGLRFR